MTYFTEFVLLVKVLSMLLSGIVILGSDCAADLRYFRWLISGRREVASLWLCLSSLGTDGNVAIIFDSVVLISWVKFDFWFLIGLLRQFIDLRLKLPVPIYKFKSDRLTVFLLLKFILNSLFSRS